MEWSLESWFFRRESWVLVQRRFFVLLLEPVVLLELANLLLDDSALSLFFWSRQWLVPRTRFQYFFNMPSGIAFCCNNVRLDCSVRNSSRTYYTLWTNESAREIEKPICVTLGVTTKDWLGVKRLISQKKITRISNKIENKPSHETSEQEKKRKEKSKT